MGGPCDFSVTPSHNYTFGFGTSLGLGLGLGLGGLDLGLGLDKSHFLSSAEFLEEEAEARIHAYHRMCRSQIVYNFFQASSCREMGQNKRLLLLL